MKAEDRFQAACVELLASIKRGGILRTIFAPDVFIDLEREIQRARTQVGAALTAKKHLLSRNNPGRPAPANAVFFATTRGSGHQIIVVPLGANYDFTVSTSGEVWFSGVLDRAAVIETIRLELPNQKYEVKIDKLTRANPKKKKAPRTKPRLGPEFVLGPRKRKAGGHKTKKDYRRKPKHGGH